jgi:AhpD family alkylhydroperoxidase
MKEENQKAVDDFLSRAEDISDDILKDTEEMLGSMPFILPVLRERPAYFALTSLADEMLCRPAHLPPKTAELVSVAAAASAGAQYCLQVHIRAAAKEGASRDEIYDAIMIAALIGKTRVLAPALRELSEAFSKNETNRRENP